MKEPELGQVTGVVTVDGAPAEGLEVEFLPQTYGGVSMGKTGKDGKYELTYKGGPKGAVIGTHTVRITRSNPGGGPAGGDTGVPIEDPLPERYNTNSELTAEVKAGPNDIPFTLTTN